MVFPEYGVTGFMDAPKMTRENVYPFMESLPDCYNGTCKLCCQAHIKGQEIQNGVACLARRNKMYITANMIEASPCEILEDPHCPSDNHYLYNTNIIFNPEGCMIAKYHKTHLVQEELLRLDEPKKSQHIYFDTEYGRFGTAICADGLFSEPIVDLVEKYHIDHLLYPMAWRNNVWLPYFQPIEWQLAMAVRYNISIIAANVHEPYETYTGSGVYRSQQVMNFTYDPIHPLRSKLIIADLPIITRANRQRHSASDNDPQHSTRGEHQAPHALDGQVVILNDTYNAKIIKGSQGEAKVCHGKLCCTLNYTRSYTQEMFVIAVFQGNHTYVDTYPLESCIVMKCNGQDLRSCTGHVDSSKTSFSNFELRATFTTEYAFPSVLPSAHAYDKFKWQFTRPDKFTNVLKSSSDWPLMAASLICLRF